MNFYPTILFAIFVFPAAWKEYKKDAKMNIPAKCINIILSIAIFSFHTDIVLNGIRDVFYGFDTIKFTYKIGESAIGLVLWGFYIFLCLAFALLSISVALRKEGARILFVRLLPLIWILGSFHLYKNTLLIMTETSNKLLLFSFLSEGLLVSCLFFIYNSGFMKRFFRFAVKESASVG